MNFAKWLEEQLELKKMTQLDLARESGISQSTISRWIHGEREPDLNKLRKIGQALGLSEKETLITTGIFEHDIFTVEEDMMEIPVLAASIPCGTPSNDYSSYAIGHESFSQSFLRSYARSMRNENLRLFIVRAKGNSMIGKGIVDGNMVIFSPDLEAKNGDIAVIDLEEEGGLCIKELLIQKNAVVLKSANPDFDPIVVVDQPVRIIGKVVMHIGYL